MKSYQHHDPVADQGKATPKPKQRNGFNAAPMPRWRTSAAYRYDSAGTATRIGMRAVAVKRSGRPGMSNAAKRAERKLKATNQ